MAQQTTGGDDRMLTRNEVAEMLHISLRTVAKLLADGEIPSHRIGGRRVLIFESDVIDYVRRQPGATQPQPQNAGAAQEA